MTGVTAAKLPRHLSNNNVISNTQQVFDGMILRNGEINGTEEFGLLTPTKQSKRHGVDVSKLTTSIVNMCLTSKLHNSDGKRRIWHNEYNSNFLSLYNNTELFLSGSPSFKILVNIKVCITDVTNVISLNRGLLLSFKLTTTTLKMYSPSANVRNEPTRVSFSMKWKSNYVKYLSGSKYVGLKYKKYDKFSDEWHKMI